VGNSKTGMVAHTCNPSTWEAEAGGWRVQSQTEIHRETLLTGKGGEKRQRGKEAGREGEQKPSPAPSCSWSLSSPVPCEVANTLLHNSK
jgi:hypothetical protein